VAYTPAAAPETLLVRGGQAAFRYLHPSGADYSWLEGWGSNIALPAALALVTPADTILLKVGGR
jgi:hypothetical protein